MPLRGWASSAGSIVLVYRAAVLHDVGTARIHVTTTGTARSQPPVLFVHGWPLHGYTWRKIIPRIEVERVCVVVDLPGLAPAEGIGGSKRAAEKVAASVMIEREGVGGGNDG